MRKLLLATATATALLTGPALACDPPTAGDKYEQNGATYEVVIVNENGCYEKLCVRPAGSKQACRWIRRPFNVNWTVWQKDG